MEERKFNSLMHSVNERWAAGVLNMEINPNRGPDIIDNEKAVEIKFKVLYPDGRYTHKDWKILGHQLDYDKEFREIYWGLGFYQINKEVKKVKSNELENITDYRELYIVNWGWMYQFPIYHHHGKTEKSEWDHDIIFAKFRLIPKIISQEEISSGKIFFTEGVNPERFKINPHL